MFRHGVRSWYTNFPNEPINASIWDKYGGFGQLTSAGANQMTEFGTFFKEYYQDQVIFDETDLFAKSTDYNRTVQSSQAFLKGMFGNNSIPISVTPIELDNVFEVLFIFIVSFKGFN